MKLSIIAAMDENRGIGIDNVLPWRLSDDLKRFKKLTLGHHIIMGRKTYESIGRPLPGRENIIITRNPDFQAPGGLIIHSLSKAIELARKQGDDEVFVIGGAEIFTNFIDIADRLYLTIVHTSAVVDTFFPEFNPNKWVAIFTEFIPAGEANKYATTFMIYERK